MIACFTSISFSYLAKARVLARTLKEHHPEWRFVVCITDREPDGFTFAIESEPFDEVIWTHDLPIDPVEGWLFKHDLVEVCTAVKGPVLDLLMEAQFDKIFYLDPDIAVLGSLQPLVDLLDRWSILLTPHQLAPDDSTIGVIDNEIGSLRHGIFNLGFIAVRNNPTGQAMARWWRSRLESFCYDDAPRGLFVDQRWCDLLPAFFDDLEIVRDPGYNVASWNLSQRRVSITREGNVLVNGYPLRFFHFTKLGWIADAMTQRYAGDNVHVYEIWSWYKRLVTQSREVTIPPGWWYYSHFNNGESIPKAARVLYRDRQDLQDAFPNPFSTDGTSYYDWLRVNADALLVSG
jgi:hypothetical protein